MSVVVVGCGRSGTNIALEMLRGHSALVATREPEDKDVFRRNRRYGSTSLTKCDTFYFNIKDLENAFHWNPEFKIIFTIRDPRDMLMSKLKRGQPISEGGDCTSFADDGTPKGAIFDMQQMLLIYNYILTHHSESIKLFKMEHMLENPKFEATRMCKFLGLKYQESMLTFASRYRNKKKAERYANVIDLNQIDMWQTWEDQYDGWLIKKGYEMYRLFEQLNDLIARFGYAPNKLG